MIKINSFLYATLFLIWLSLFIYPIAGIGQINNDSIANQRKVILRSSIYVPSGITFSTSLEKKISKTTSISLKGNIIYVQNNPNSNNPTIVDKALIAGIGTLEYKYFYTYKRRIRKGHNTKYCSGSYFALEYYASSSPFSAHSQIVNYESSHGLYCNYGFQTQINNTRLFFNAYAGVLLFAIPFNKNSISADVDPAQVGLGLGYRF